MQALLIGLIVAILFGGGGYYIGMQTGEDRAVMQQKNGVMEGDVMGTESDDMMQKNDAMEKASSTDPMMKDDAMMEGDSMQKAN